MLGNAVPSLLQHVRRLAASASSDEQLLADFIARRSDEAFSALLGRHGPMVLTLTICQQTDTLTAGDFAGVAREGQDNGGLVIHSLLVR